MNFTGEATINNIHAVEAHDLVSGAENGGLISAIQIVTAGSVARRPPVHVDYSAVPEDLQPRVKAAFSQEKCRYPDMHLLRLAGAVLVGQGSVIVRGEARWALIKDSAREFIAHDKSPDGLERDTDGSYSIPRQIDRNVEDHCLLLQRPWSNNFGHWMVDQAMALSYLVHTGNLPTRNIVVSKVPSLRLREVMLQTINAILPDALVYEHPDDKVWKFNSLSYIMPLHIPPMFKLPAALDYLRDDILAARVTPSVLYPRRFHIVRQGSTRKLTNEPEIVALSAKYGFEPISPEALPLVEQAALFNQAEAVLGVKGAAMTNALFATPTCHLMLMSPASFVDPFFFDIASTRGVAYSETFGEIVTDRAFIGHNDFRVSPEDVEAMIRATLTDLL